MPALVFGKAMTSRMDAVLQRIDIKRSNPAGENKTMSVSTCRTTQSMLTKCDPAMRRRATAERMQQVIERGLFAIVKLGWHHSVVSKRGHDAV